MHTQFIGPVSVTIGADTEIPSECFQGVVLPDIKSVTPEDNLIPRMRKLQSFWKASPYYLEEASSKSEHCAL